MRRLLVVFGLIFVVAAIWLQAQAEDSRPLPSLLPPAALLYLEAKDFNGLLSSWNRSAEKRKWVGSANFQVISMSRLMQRLGQAENEFAEVAGVPLGMSLVDQVAGAQSGFAFYNLASLSFVYITQMPASRVEATALWRERARYQTRQVAAIPFYVKADQAGGRSVMFTVYKKWFVLATDQGRMAETLVLLSGAKAASLATEPWFAQAEKQAQAQGDLRLVYNLKTMLATPQFRTYWMQRNASELKPFAAGISDLFEVKTGFEEHRTLIRTAAAPASPPDSALAQALTYAPADISLYRAWSRPETRQVNEALQQVLAGERPTVNMYTAPAPDVTPEAGAVGSEADLEIRIDEPPVERSAEPSVAPLVTSVMAMQPSALLHVQTTTVLHDQVFVLPESAVVLICKQPGMLNIPGQLDPLRVSVEGNALIISRMDLPRAATAPSLAPDVTYTAAYNQHAEWPHYQKLFAVVDASHNGAPAFFSGNVQSLGSALSRLESASVVSSDHGTLVQETIRYQLAQP